MANDNAKISKYIKIAEYFKERIIKGDIIPGEQLLTESEITKKFNVSRHTVRQALMELENEGYIYKEQGKGTFCDFKEIKEEKKIVAVLTTYISDYIFPSIIRGIEETLSSAGYAFILFNTNNDKQKEAEYLRKIMEYDVKGIIVEPTKSATENTNLFLYKELEKKNIPYIMINAKYEDLDPPYVILDDVEGGYITTNFLLKQGHKNIAGIFKCDDIQGINREKGYVEALREMSINIVPEYIGRFTTGERDILPYEFTVNLLKSDKRPSAIVCYNDLIAVNVLQAVRDTGLKVPEDISIIGYDDSSFSTATEVKFTTVKHPKDDMGRRTASLIIDMIEGRAEKPRYIYKPELIVRDSSNNMETLY